MTHVPEIAAGYLITGVALAGYAVWILVRTRALAKQVERLEPSSEERLSQ